MPAGKGQKDRRRLILGLFMAVSLKRNPFLAECPFRLMVSRFKIGQSPQTWTAVALWRYGEPMFAESNHGEPGRGGTGRAGSPFEEK
jgi:hypothetical protein